MTRKRGGDALVLSAALLAILAAVASACGADPPLGRPDDEVNLDAGADALGSDAAVGGDSHAGSDGATAGDAGDAGEASATDDGSNESGDDALDDFTNPYQDAFEMFDAASDTAITTEGDSSASPDTSDIHDGAGPLPDGPMMISD
jgi:predicted small lipoprotein YifL